jgi:ADP-ribose pyrophosphatase
LLDKPITKVVKQTSNSHLNIFLIEQPNHKTFYQFASRKQDVNDLALFNEKFVVDAVRILPFFYKDNEIYFVLIKEFRSPVNRVLYSIPAGLVDPNEELLAAAKRELTEETGYVFKRLVLNSGINFISPGLSDESVATYVVEVDPVPVLQHLDEFEEISVQLVKKSDLISFIEKNDADFGFQSKMYLLYIYYRDLAENILAKSKNK